MRFIVVCHRCAATPPVCFTIRENGDGVYIIVLRELSDRYSAIPVVSSNNDWEIVVDSDIRSKYRAHEMARGPGLNIR